MRSKDTQYISISRVVATFFIVICHIIKYYTFIPAHAYLGQFFSIGVPIFIIISGKLYGLKSHDNLNTKQFYYSRFLKVILPTQLWAILLFIVCNTVTYINLISVFLNLQGVEWVFQNYSIFSGGVMLGHTWFVTIISICYLFVPVLKNLSENKKAIPILLMGAWIFYFPLRIIFGINIYYFCLFITSYYTSRTFNKNIPNIFSITTLIICGIAIRYVGHLWFDESVLYSVFIVPVSEIMVSISIIDYCKILSENNTRHYKVVEFYGFKVIEKYSFYVYLVHYPLVKLCYDRFNLVVATFVFIVGVALFSVSIKSIHEKCVLLFGLYK